MSTKLFASLASKSSHGGSYLPSTNVGVLAEGAPPLCTGDTHICPLCLPNGIPHPPLPILQPVVSDVLVGGKPWLCLGDSHSCVGPAKIISACLSIQRESAYSPVSEETNHEQKSSGFVYST